MQFDIGVTPRPADRPAPPEGVRRVLCFDGDPATVATVAEAMRRVAGWHVVLAPVGSVGVVLAYVDPPDLVLLDPALGDGSAHDVARALRRDDATRAVPLVLLEHGPDGFTADHAWARSLVDAGDATVLPAPVQVEALVDLLVGVSTPTSDPA